ncbi:helix-turn-helix transcriptional regulator [Streptomyces aidingensis]|uniref:Predicted DNA-binding transcriptional regulator YafY, contains an HTH and WYL domains n=1 Tax=Streptomyces aidingensis TaxID=910347 RepID=A0A1I1NC83_9ACTN|nr:YafY family protein [Streptomyces aidingensis]SFC91360.1 Predicted DNA-binding transcriptional regulator YafY, contains an HTH and WYL domains [Streptomyces aidingensis]
MANTSSRTLRLLSLLQTHRYWPGRELADRLGVSPRTLRRDVDRLRALGYPVNAHRGVDGGYQLAAGAALPPLLVDDEEAVALAIGLRTAAQGGVAGIEEAAVRALAKVVQVMPQRLRRRVDALRRVTVPASWNGAGPVVDGGVLTTVAQACRDEERLRFGYRARTGEESLRYVEPHRLVSMGQRWYLVAYDLPRQDWRSFRLDRVTGPEATRERFRPRELPAADAGEFVRRSIGAIQAEYTVEIRVRAAAGPVRAQVGQWAEVTEEGPGVSVLRMTTHSLDWPVLAAGSLGAEFEVLGPPELLARVREWSRRLARAAGHGEPADAGTETGSETDAGTETGTDPDPDGRADGVRTG